MDAKALKKLKRISLIFKGMVPYSSTFRFSPDYEAFPATREALTTVTRGQILNQTLQHGMGQELLKASRKNDPFGPQPDKDFQMLRGVFRSIMRINCLLVGMNVDEIRRTGSRNDVHQVNNPASYHLSPRRQQVSNVTFD